MPWLGTVQEKCVFLNYVVWLVCLFHFLSRKQTKIRNMQLCEDYLTMIALWESPQHKCLEASSSVSFQWIRCVSAYNLLPVHLEEGRVSCSLFKPLSVHRRTSLVGSRSKAMMGSIETEGKAYFSLFLKERTYLSVLFLSACVYRVPYIKHPQDSALLLLCILLCQILNSTKRDLNFRFILVLLVTMMEDSSGYFRLHF